MQESEFEVDRRGWAADALSQSLQAMILRGVAVGQVVLLIAVIATPETGVMLAPLIAAHLLVALVAMGVGAGRIPVWVLAAALPTVALLDLAVADSDEGVLCFAATWLIHGGQVIPSMLMRGRSGRVASAYIGLVIPLAVGTVHPDWVVSFVIPNIVAGLGIRSGGRLALGWLGSFAERVDEEEASRWRERRRVSEVRSAISEAAEQARILHDTAINTLGAVASGGAAVRDALLVRDRCLRDTKTLEILVDGRAVDTDVEGGDLAQHLGLSIERRGMADEELARVTALIPSDVIHALSGAVGEALRNVAKHAGTGTALIDVRETQGELVVTVTDEGAGFDGAIVAGRGLAESVVARSEQVGVAVEVSSVVGAGTEVRLRYPLDPADRVDPDRENPEDPGLDAVVVEVRRRGCWLWTVGTVAVGICIDTFGRRPYLSPTYVMLALVAVVGLLSWYHLRGRDHLNIPMAALVVASVPVANLLAIAATDFGRGEVLRWQAIGVVAPLVILLVFGRTRGPLVLGVAGLFASSTAATVIAATESAAAAAVIPVGTAPAVGLLAAWAMFYKRFEEVGRSGADAHRDAAEAAVERAGMEAVATARQRWHQAGLNRSLDLLRGLARGDLDPQDRKIQTDCSKEEAYLRQLTMLDPKIVRLGHHLASGLALARSHGIKLVVRTGDRDVSESATAAELGGLLTSVLTSAPAGSELTVGFFASQGRLRFTLVGPAPVPSQAAASWRAPDGWQLALQTHDGTDIVEVLERDGPAS